MNKPSFTSENPRFVWNIGSLPEEFPDLPPQGETVDLIDRLSGRPVVSIAPGWGNLFCLEHTGLENCTPFTSLETWLNELDDDALESEGLPS